MVLVSIFCICLTHSIISLLDIFIPAPVCASHAQYYRAFEQSIRFCEKYIPGDRLKTQKVV